MCIRDSLALLRQHAWPGNVRELRNVLDRAWAMSPDPAFRALRLSTASGPAQGFAEVVDTSLPFKDAKERWNDHFERRYLTALFTATGGNLSRAAIQAGLSRRHFRELLYKHGIVARSAEGSGEGDGDDGDGDGAR